MPHLVCPRCLTELEDKGEWWSGRACECGNCKGILADKIWLESNMHQGDFERLRGRVFSGSPAGILCPNCLSFESGRSVEMSKFTVSSDVKNFEVDGCRSCGSMWFDQGELESYEEGGPGDPSIVRARNKEDSVESTEKGIAGNVGLGILDLLTAILTGF